MFFHPNHIFQRIRSAETVKIPDITTFKKIIFGRKF